MLFFTNLGSTCFFNCAFQLLLNNPDFRKSVREYFTNHTFPRQDLIFCLHTIIERYETSLESSKGCTIAKRDTLLELAQFFPIIRGNQQQDVLECLDQIMDTLSIQHEVVVPNRNYEELRNLLQRQYGLFSNLWGVQKRIDVCNECEHEIREEYIPFLCIQRTRQENTFSGARCDHCQQVCDRTVRYTIHDTPQSFIVQVGRHNDDGTKNHKNVTLNEHVSVNSKMYSLRVVVYHEGYTFSSGHYSCAVYHPKRRQWLYNSDEFSQFFDESFEIRTYKPNCTYAGLYCCVN